MKHGQHPDALRFRSSHRICTAAFYQQAKPSGQPFQPFRIVIFLFLYEGLRLAAKKALLWVACVGEIMRDEPRSYSFHFREEKRQLAAGSPVWCEQFTVRNVFACSPGEIGVRWEKLVFAWRLPADSGLGISRHN